MGFKWDDITTELPDLTSYFVKEATGTANQFKKYTGQQLIDWINSFIPTTIDTTIGGVNAAYPATSIADGIEQALIDGHRTFLVLDNFSQFGDIGAITEPIFLISFGTEKILNMSFSNTSPLTIYSDNIKYSISGISQIFVTGTYFYINKGTILGDSSENNFGACIIDANNLVVNTGSNSLTINYIRTCRYLEIISNTTNHTRVYISNGTIGYLKTSGVFSTSTTEGGIRVVNCVVNYLDNSGTNYILNIYGSSLWFKILFAKNPFKMIQRGNVLIANDCTFDALVTLAAGSLYLNKCIFPSTYTLGTTAAGVLDSCIFSSSFVNNANGLDFKNIKVAGNLTNTGGKNNFSFLRVTGNLTESGDENIFSNCRVTGTADNSAATNQIKWEIN